MKQLVLIFMLLAALFAVLMMTADTAQACGPLAAIMEHRAARLSACSTCMNVQACTPAATLPAVCTPACACTQRVLVANSTPVVLEVTTPFRLLRRVAVAVIHPVATIRNLRATACSSATGFRACTQAGVPCAPAVPQACTTAK